VTVYDQLGRRLWRKDVDKNLHPGENVIVWDANNGGRLASGTYILQLTALDGSGKVKGVKREKINVYALKSYSKKRSP
jgi:aspartate 1-decarboxylase